jgi:hypothetical protein
VSRVTSPAPERGRKKKLLTGFLFYFTFPYTSAPARSIAHFRHVSLVGRAGAVVGLLGRGLLVLPHAPTSSGDAAGERAGVVVLVPDTQAARGALRETSATGILHHSPTPASVLRFTIILLFTCLPRYTALLTTSMLLSCFHPSAGSCHTLCRHLFRGNLTTSKTTASSKRGRRSPRSSARVSHAQRQRLDTRLGRGPRHERCLG